MRGVFLAIAAVGLVLGAGGALAASKGVIKPPASMDAKGVDEWRKTNIDEAGGWILLHADGAALSYGGGPNGVKPDKDGFLNLDVRREYYKAIRMGPSASRSNLQTWVADCEARRLKVTSMNFYTFNNMTGGGFRKSAEDPSWIAVAPASEDSAVFDRICAARPAGK